MKLEVGMYVRTDNGIIGRIYEKIGDMFTYKDSNRDYITYGGLHNEILKSSHNIIDLIEVGDYVNGHKVYDEFRLDTDDYGVNFIEIGIESDKFLNHYIKKEDIKSIVTKEQFESISYKVEE